MLKESGRAFAARSLMHRCSGRFPSSLPGALAAGALPLLILLASCASAPPTARPPMRPAEAREFIAGLMPARVADRPGWATDLYAAFATLRLEVTPENVCAALAVAEQESSFQVDPVVPRLGDITRTEIDRRAQRAGVPTLLVHGALRLDSPTGRSWGERIDAARSERELSEIFEDFVGQVPLGKRLFAGWNPVRTGGPMQVSIAYAERHTSERPYPYPVAISLRHEVFTRRGGLYFGVAHLLDYPAHYDRMLFRFADFNAGHHASRNAAFQNAVSVASGVPLALDGDLVRFDGDRDAAPGSTELAVRVLASRLDMSNAGIRRALDQGDRPEFERSELFERVYALADRLNGRPLPRALLPQIELHSPKITRSLTTAWFAERVDGRYQRCLGRAAGG